MSSQPADLRDRVIVITGANTGIGLASARALAARGAHLILACRSAAKTEPVIAELKSTTGNRAIELLALDLASLADVRRAAAELLARDLPIHVLINNAGVAGQRGLTKDGFELTFGVNHLGHFLLTELLLDRIKESAPARIVNVASASHYQAKGIDFAALRKPTATVTGLREYEVSKLANVLFTRELARRLEGTGVTTYVVHPGVIASDIWRRIPWPFRSLAKRFMKTTEQGAVSTLRCATDPTLAAQSGGYYHHDGLPRRPSKRSQDDALAAELWAASERYCRPEG